jgi:hypothetical protein
MGSVQWEGMGSVLISDFGVGGGAEEGVNPDGVSPDF